MSKQLRITTKTQLYRDGLSDKAIKHRLSEKSLYKITEKYYSYDPYSPENVADLIYGPSYVSFERALQFYGIIPEYVPVCTSATFEMDDALLKNTFHHEYTDGCGNRYAYFDIPKSAFPYCIMSFENKFTAIPRTIASAEKAVCDLLYKGEHVDRYERFEDLMFEGYRFDEEEFTEQINRDVMLFLIERYGDDSNIKYLGEWMRNDHEKWMSAVIIE